MPSVEDQPSKILCRTSRVLRNRLGMNGLLCRVIRLPAACPPNATAATSSATCTNPTLRRPATRVSDYMGLEEGAGFTLSKPPLGAFLSGKSTAILPAAQQAELELEAVLYRASLVPANLTDENPVPVLRRVLLGPLRDNLCADAQARLSTSTRQILNAGLAEAAAAFPASRRRQHELPHQCLARPQEVVARLAALTLLPPSPTLSQEECDEALAIRLARPCPTFIEI
ncbi:hypothetical protein B0H14DRAFT_3775695 [Mycena olivaceomarginata]|nr:hypothetical protein B0H14DRAFT_3775695 [Mycena olivaceomarginata]